MLEESIKQELKTYFEKIREEVVLELEPGNSESRTELLEYLRDMAALSSKIRLNEKPGVGEDGTKFSVSPLGEPARIFFRGIPGGHEFSSLVLAILQSGGHPVRLDSNIIKRLEAIHSPLVFETVVSLDCHNCPDVVQTLNSLAISQPKIQHTMIDGNLYPELVAERKIQGVPSVFLNGKPFLNGKVDASMILEKILEIVSSENHSPVEKTEIQTSSPSQNASSSFDIVVIGGGPGGVASAVYAARKGLKVGLVAQRVGGQVKDTIGIENLISVAYTTGPELTGKLTDLLKQNGIVTREFLKVERIESLPHEKRIFLNSGEVLVTRAIILSTGAKWREINVPGEKEYLGKGVAYCPHCDGPFFKGKDIAVIGGGNSGVEAALDLAGIVKSVTLLEFAPELKADKVLVDKMKETPNIRFVTNAQTKEILGKEGKVVGISYLDRGTGQMETFDSEGVFVQIGLLPNSGFVRDLVECNNFGEIVVDEKCRTSVEGIFACGDVTNTPYKQIIIAMGEGAKAGIAAFEYLLTSHRIAA